MHAQTTKLIPRAIAAVMPGIMVLFVWAGTHAQSQNSIPGKFAEFGNTNTEDAMARLDQFALELQSHPDLRGIIVASNKSNSPRGTFLRLAHGYLNYLVNARGIEAARIREGEKKRKSSFELWTMPINEFSAVPEQDASVEPPSPQLFDQIWIGPERQCVGELTIELYKLEDGLRFLSEALQQQTRAKAWIVIHPRTRDSQATSGRTLRRTRQLLLKNGIKADRVLTAIRSPRASSCASVKMWIVPANSTKADEDAYYSQLMNEAESAKYTARRLEFSGNQHVSDYTLREKFGQHEGEMFSRRLLDQSLKNFNSLRSLYPVTLEDVEERLDREEKLIDLAIYFRERPR
jgi:surface antigen-like variable number repeat protein